MTTFDLTQVLPYMTPASSPEDTAPIYAYGSADAPIVRVFSPTLFVTYTIPEPGVLVFVRERDMASAEHETLHARAVENLRRRIEKKRLRFEARGATHHAKLDGQHDASLLLLDELWDPPTCVSHHEGDLLAAVPARGTLVFTGTSSTNGLNELRAHTAKTSLSSELFVRVDKHWQPYGIGRA